MPAEPAVKRAIAFVDGQNLFHNARNAFGYTYPNYDVQKLARAVCAGHGWTLDHVQFYTGVPSAADDAFWHGFWSNKLAMMAQNWRSCHEPPSGDFPENGARKLLADGSNPRVLQRQAPGTFPKRAELGKVRDWCW